MIATIWPNKLGWTIKTRHGEAEVCDLANRLRVYVPIASKERWMDLPYRGEPRWITEERRVVCDVPLGTDPIEAVRLCLEFGLVVVVGCGPVAHIPMVTIAPMLAESVA